MDISRRLRTSLALAVCGALSLLGPLAVRAPLADAETRGGGEAASALAQTRPNILLITTDDQRADELHPMSTVRNQLIARGTRFTRAYAPFPLCCPARATIMSGQHAHNHGVLGNQSAEFPLGGYVAFDGTSSLATWLRSSGYQTAFVGKYLNNYGAVKPVAVPPGWQDWHASVGGGHYFSTRLREAPTGTNPVTRLYDGPYQADLYADVSTDVIERRIGSDAPLFLWTSFYGPHVGRPAEPDDPAIDTPAVAPRHHDAFAGTPLRRRGYDPSFNEADVSDKPAYVRNRQPLSTTTQGMLTELYQQRLESLLAVDEAVAEVISALRDAGELDNTIIAFTSDNGYMLGEHRILEGKVVPYEPSARVPLIVRGPGFPAGVQRTQPAALIDLAPTFVEAAGGTAGLPLDGVSLRPLANDATVGADRTLVMETGPRSTTVGAPWHYRGVRSSRWLYIEYGETPEVEMYDLTNDPYQLVNRAGDPAYSADRQRLAAQLAALRACSGAGCR